MGAKVAVVGGGSTYTPELIEGIARPRRPLPIDELVLLDIDPERARDRRRACPPDADAPRLAGRLHAHRRPRRGRRRGRLRARPAAGRWPSGSLRRRDAPATLRHDRPGDDRRRRLRQGAADRSGRPRHRGARGTDRGAPAHWIVDFTNPVGIVTQALLDEGHRAIGLCNVAIGFQRRFAERFGVAPEQVRARSRRAQPPHLDPGGPRRRRRPAAGDPRDRRREIARDVGVPADVVRALRAIPSYYLRYYYAFQTVLAEQRRDGQHRGPRRSPISSATLLEMYRDPTLDKKPALLETAAARSTARRPPS